MKSNIVYIYTLSDPTTKEIRYVGKTINLRQRYSQIIHAKKNGKNLIKWVNELQTKRYNPIMKTLDITNKDDWQYVEKYWIAQFRAWGFNLLNITAGGESDHNWNHTKDSIDKMIENGNRKSVYQIDRENGKILKNLIV